MDNGKKLVLIGAGGAVFTQGLVMELFAEKWYEPWELCLVDKDKPALDAMNVICRGFSVGFTGIL